MRRSFCLLYCIGLIGLIRHGFGGVDYGCEVGYVVGLVVRATPSYFLVIVLDWIGKSD